MERFLVGLMGKCECVSDLYQRIVTLFTKAFVVTLRDGHDFQAQVSNSKSGQQKCSVYTVCL